MTLFDLLPIRKPRTTLDNLLPQVDDTEWSGCLDTFIEQRKRFRDR